MVSAHRNNASLALLQSIESDSDRQITKFLSANMKYAPGNIQDSSSQRLTPDRDMFDPTHHDEQEHEHPFSDADVDPLQDTCGHSFEGVDAVITMDSTTKMAGQSVAPFLAKHIPDQYAPLGVPQSTMSTKKDPNTKFCYRHRPDSKCRRTADEPTMENLQRNLEKLSQADKQGISHVWSLFSAAPAKHRNLMLQGILSQCCFPQLSYLSTAVRDLIRIDFISALPSEISYKILCYLDTTSLCKAAQVSQKWRILADDDVVWHKMCEQHIDRKCTKCGWGLPLLERKRLRDWKRQQQLRATGRGLNQWSPKLTPAPEDNIEFIKTLVLKSGSKRTASLSVEELQASSSDASKRQCVEVVEPPQKFRPWKDVYKDRFKVGTNWKYGRCSTKVFRGHTNGVMCLQFEDNILATGSYDTTIKIWDMTTGECLRTLRGHTSGVRTLQFDDSKLISGSLDRTVKIWNWRTGERIASLDGHTEGVISVNFEGPYLVSGSIDKTIRVLNYNDKSTRTLTGHKDWVNAVKVDSASRTLFSASDDCTIRLWDLETMKPIRIYEGHVGQVQQVTLLPAEYEPDDVDEDEADENSSTISNASSATPQPVEHSPFEGWSSSRPRPPKYIMTASLDSTVRLWEVESGRCLKTFFGHVEGVWALGADSLRVISGAEDRMVKVWDARSGRCQRTFTGHAGPVTCVCLGDSRMVTGSEDCEVRLYSFRTEDHPDQTNPLGTAGDSNPSVA